MFEKKDYDEFIKLDKYQKTFANKVLLARLNIKNKNHVNKEIQVNVDTFKEYKCRVYQYSLFEKEIKEIWNKIKKSEKWIDILDYIEIDLISTSGCNGGI
jgi:uncharacterized Fe-S cluster-containing protein